MTRNRSAGLSGLLSVLWLAGCSGSQGEAGPAGPAGEVGRPGPAVVTLNAVEPPGANCRYGGIQLQFGPDIDGDVLLDPGEINPALTKYICEGTAGVDCHDLNGNDLCEVGSEDKDLDGDCDVDDCHTPNDADYVKNGALPQAAGFNVSGTGETGGLFRSRYGLRVDSGDAGLTGDHDLLVMRSTVNNVNATRFRLDDTGGFLAQGALGIGPIPTTGPGVRLQWWPFKGALRFGSANATEWDDVNTGFYSFAGGNGNTASAFASFAFGDENAVSGVDSAAFGTNNTVSATAGFATGASNRCTGFGCVAMGFTNTAGGQGAVAIGYRVTADADYAVALGHRASANGHDGAFVWADQSTTDSLEASANNQFNTRAAGGYRLFTNATTTTGVSLNAGGSSWNVISDRRAKTDFEPVDGEQVLRKLARMPLEKWSYKEEVGKPRHVGPMAQDFREAFGLGHNDTTINTIDLDGINMVAIQALEKRSAKVEALERELAETKLRLERMEKKLEELSGSGR